MGTNKKPHLTENEVNKVITFFLAIEIASENLNFILSKGILAREDKQSSNRFLRFWKDRTKKFWNIFNGVQDTPDTEVVELIQGLENLGEFLPILNCLKGEELHMVLDFAKKLVNSEFDIDNPIYDFSEAYLGFKSHEIWDALKENCQEVEAEDFEGLTIKEDGVIYQIIHGRDVFTKKNDICIIIDGKFHSIFNGKVELETQSLLHINNFLYNKKTIRKGDFIPMSLITKGDATYEIGVYEGIATSLKWRYINTGVENHIPVYGNSPVRETETKKRRYIMIDKTIVYLDEFLVKNKV